MKHFVFIELSSLGIAYEMVQKLTESELLTHESSLKVFELSASPQGSVLIFSSDSLDRIQRVETEVGRHKDFLISYHVESFLDPRIIKAYLNQTLEPIQNILLIAEFSSLTIAIKTCVFLLKSGFEICEFRFFRSAIHKCYLSMTTENEKNVDCIVKDLKTNSVQFSIVQKPNQFIKSMYQI